MKKQREGSQRGHMLLSLSSYVIGHQGCSDSATPSGGPCVWPLVLYVNYWCQRKGSSFHSVHLGFPVVTCPWGGSEWGADVCLHLQGLSPMIPICAHCLVVCVCACLGVCMHTCVHMHNRIPRGNKKGLGSVPEVAKCDPNLPKGGPDVLICGYPESIAGAQWVFMTLEGLLLSSASSMWVMLRASMWVWKQESISRERRHIWKG